MKPEALAATKPTTVAPGMLTSLARALQTKVLRVERPGSPRGRAPEVGRRPVHRPLEDTRDVVKRMKELASVWGINEHGAAVRVREKLQGLLVRPHAHRLPMRFELRHGVFYRAESSPLRFVCTFDRL